MNVLTKIIFSSATQN